MTYVEIKVSDPHMGDVKIDNGGKPDDSSLMTNPKNQITENIDEVVARVKAAYGISPRETGYLELGRAARKAIMHQDRDNPQSDTTLGRTIVQMMKEMGADQPRPIKDSPQA